MSLRFILGRSGTGKTRQCLIEIAELARKEPLGPPLVLLAPDQATYQLERDLLSTGGLEGFIRPEIVSFQRLAYRILEAAGGGQPPMLGAIGRRVYLARLVKQHSAELRYFARSARFTGFYEQLDRVFRELMLHDIEAADLQHAAEQAAEDKHAPSHLSEKLQDLALLAGEYRKELGTRFLDPDYPITLASEHLARTSRYRGARIWLDGFADITPQQLRLLRRLMQGAASTSVALNLDQNCLNDPEREEPVFFATKNTYYRLLDVGRDEGILRGQDCIFTSPPRRYQSKILLEVEQAFSAPGAIAHSAEDHNQESLRIGVSPDRRSEIAWIARQIINLVRNQGIRYRQIALVLRDLEPYEAHIREIFGMFNIPAFIDRRGDMAHHPLVELVRSAIELARGGWRRDPLFRYLRTGFLHKGVSGISDEDIDRLEMYVVTRGLEQQRWSRDELWTSQLPESEESYDEAHSRKEPEFENDTDPLAWRNSVEEPLQPLFALLKEEQAQAGKLAEILENLLDRLNVEETLETWRTEALESGEPQLAQEHEQAYQGVLDVLQELRTSAGHSGMPVRQLTELLDVGLQELTLGFVPPGLDQVLVGSIERSRQPELHTVFLPGFSEGAYPLGKEPGGLLPDEDRDYLNNLNIALAPSAKQKQRGEPYIAYVALTRASQSVVLTYPSSDEEGNKINPSPYIGELTAHFGNELIETLPREHEQPPCDPFSIAAYIGAYQGQVSPEGHRARALSEKLQDSPRIGPLLKMMNRASLQQQAVLDDDLADLFKKKDVFFSVSRLERFAACPFRHFAQYGLKLKAVEPFELEARHLGSIAHKVLQLLVNTWIEQKSPWKDVEPSEAIEEADCILDRLIATGTLTLSTESAREQNILTDLREHIHRTLDAMLAGARVTGFEPADVEYNLKESAFKIKCEDTNVHLVGFVDRVDICERGEQRFLRVIDYKTRQLKFEWQKWFAGLQLQLPTYLLALSRENQNSIPVAALYLPIRPNRPDISVDLSGDTEAARNAWLGMYCHRGFFSKDHYQLLDNSLEPGQSSDFYKLQITKGSKKKPPQVSSVQTDPVPAHVVNRILDITEEHLHNLSTQILDGLITVNPYDLKKQIPCDYCDFGPVCRVDARNHDYRKIENLTTKELQNRLGANDE